MMKSRFFIITLIFCLSLSILSVSASDNHTAILEDDDYHTFYELNQSIYDAENELNLEHDYKYDNTSININKDVEFTINGNDRIIDGINGFESLIFSSNEPVIINNLTFRNCVNTTIISTSPLIFNNVKFINCSGILNASYSEFLSIRSKTIFDNCLFNMNEDKYSAIGCWQGSILIINNTIFDGGAFENGCINVLNRLELYIENTTFMNLNSKSSTVINYKGWNLTIKKSKFINLHSNLSAGAIMGKYFPHIYYTINGTEIFPNDPYLIEDCEFINVTSENNGGAIYFDMNSGAGHKIQTLNIVNTKFTDCKSKYGGGIANMGGVLNIFNTTFENNYASFKGGAIYTTWSDLNISLSEISNNSAEKNAGAVYFDKGNLTISLSSFTDNKVINISDNTGQCIYAYDADVNLADSIFNNTGVSIYAEFTASHNTENITQNDDIFLWDNKDYIVSVESEGIRLTFINNTISTDNLPSKFDLRDWGWVSPEKKQGDNDDCWAFATVSSLESSLLKATGILYNLSQNYVQKLQLKYAVNGDLRNSLTGFAYSGLGYALSWYGALQLDSDYDDRGMIADTDINDERIHLQDAMIIFGKQNNTEKLIKEAILKYGAVTIQFIFNEPAEEINSTGEDIAVMDHSTHFVSVVGWDDEYEGGSWIYKDSMGGFGNITYNSTTLWNNDYYAIVSQNSAICYIFENNIDYHVNYQTDLTGLTGFNSNYTYYSNEFTSKYSELIGAVGTYFNDSGIEYSFDVYVNGVKVHTQTGVSEFAGFRTIILNSYIPVKAGDNFKVVFKNNALPYQAYSRQHYLEGMSMISKDNSTWSDITLENKTVCLKVYTVADDSKIINNKDISVDYNGGSYFSVKVVTSDGRTVGAGASVKFTINGKTTSVKTDKNGIAKIKINDLPKKYILTTSYNGKTYKNTVTVKQVLTASKVSVKKTARKFTLSGKLKINGKAVKGKTVKFKFKGKVYSAKTNKNGVAKVTINKKIIKKLKKGKYTVKVTYLKDTIKTAVNVKG